MACSGSFLSSHGEKHPEPKSGRDLDPDKPRCATACRKDETDQIFSELFFWIFIPGP